MVNFCLLHCPVSWKCRAFVAGIIWVLFLSELTQNANNTTYWLWTLRAAGSIFLCHRNRLGPASKEATSPVYVDGCYKERVRRYTMISPYSWFLLKGKMKTTLKYRSCWFWLIVSVIPWRNWWELPTLNMAQRYQEIILILTAIWYLERLFLFFLCFKLMSF